MVVRYYSGNALGCVFALCRVKFYSRVAPTVPMDVSLLKRQKYVYGAFGISKWLYKHVVTRAVQ